MNTTFLSELNWLAILCAALGYFALGALWYSKILFANKWLELTKINPKDPDATKNMAVIMLASLFFMFLTAIGLAILQNKLQLNGGWMSGLKLGLVTGLLIGSSAISISYCYEKRAAGLHFINGGYTVIGNIIAAIIICMWP
ncbi:MAG TPA: DUF1761 domain-containing protein [Ferruginibacter sp.]|nr:DUF1761 domain-containing protein [Ferruginibacter sp.]